MGTPERDARPSWLAPDFGKGRGVFPPNDIAAPAAPAGLLNVEKLPFWIQAAIRLGVKFIRVAAGAVPPAAAEFHPSDFHEEPGCCNECGCVHPPLIDEYYFWLVASKVFNAVDQDEYYDPTLQESTLWHDPNNLPKLLDWKSAPAARLAWSRVHNGEFKQPRRSDDVVQLTPGIIPDLNYIGRVADSLTFSVTGGIAPVGYFGSDAPGFRYDLATDFSVALPLVEDPPTLPSLYPAGLPVYPYFVFVEPGDRLFPDSIYSPAVAVAGVLRCHCRFESALKWYQLFLNPLEADNTWVHCSHDTRLPPPPPPPPRIEEDIHPHRKPHSHPHNAEDISDEYTANISVEIEEPPIAIPLPPEMCCDSTHISAAVARNRAMLLHYLDTLVEWSRALMRQNSRESAQQARLILDTAARILGPCPRTVINHDVPKHETVTTFKPLIPPLNPRLMNLYCHVRDGLDLVHRCLSDARLRNSTKECRAPYWGQDPCHCGPIEHHCGCESINEPCCDEDDWCHPHSPYRFVFLLQKAQEAAAKVRELGSALLSAFERGDAEYLASMRVRHETQLADLTIKVRQDQWRDADWQVKALGKTKEISQTNWRYYQGLISAGLNTGELGYQSNMNLSISTRSAAIPIEASGEAMRLVPDIYVGTSGVNLKLPPGTKMGDMLETIARIMNETADVEGITASLDLTQAGWQRRLDEWVHQVDVLGIEIEQIEIQILGAERRRNQALEELNIQRRQLEQSREVLDFLRRQIHQPRTVSLPAEGNCRPLFEDV